MTIWGAWSLSLTSKCQVSAERRVFDLESEVNQRPWFNTYWGLTFCYWIFLFSHSKALDTNIGIIANFVFVKNLNMPGPLSRDAIYCILNDTFSHINLQRFTPSYTRVSQAKHSCAKIKRRRFAYEYQPTFCISFTKSTISIIIF